jgi:putative endonuclease
MSFTVYILYSSVKDKYYIGQTQDLNNRLIEHNSGESKSTKSGIPWRIAYQKEFDTRKAAMSFESHLKKMKNRRYLESIIKPG